MNSDLSALLDAIFGRQDLDSVSLDEMYELIKEFPSFNAGHYLLSKKLKLENQVASFEKETMRTALYFNNPFWLQSVLNEENLPVTEYPKPVYSGDNGKEYSIEEIHGEESVSIVTEYFVEEKVAEPEPSFNKDLSDEPATNAEPSFKEELAESNTTSPETAFNEEQSSEFNTRPVTSFDDLMSKYHIGPTEPVQETKIESTEDRSQNLAEESPGETVFEKTSGPEPWQVSNKEQVNDHSEDFHPEGNKDSYEIREEVFNEYGIFEEVIVKKTDFDLEAFDRPLVPVPISPGEPSAHILDEVQPDEGYSAEALTTEEVPEAANETIVENPVPEDTEQKQVEADYEAFDRPIDNKTGDESEANTEISTDLESFPEITPGDQQPEDIGTGESHDEKQDHSWDGQLPGLAARFDEQQKARTPFDPKKAESIVFAPYHMIDYFASQGIRLVLEENPVDPFGKQLKSFTDWLKVMKKLPVRNAAEKADDKEVDQIRHFAAHSIDEREILTESMAEVLAKQGMFENAIALYQKLSLIYPPKSAYFASRIEQLKASLP